MTSSGKPSRRAPQTRSQQPQPTGHLARCQSVQTAFIYLQYNGRVGWLSHRMQTVVLRIRRTPPGDSWRAPGHPRVPRSQGRPGQGAFPSILATPTGSFPRDRTGQVRMGRARRGAPDKRALCDLQRDGPTCAPGRTTPPRARTPTPGSVRRFTWETDSHNAISASQRGVFHSHCLTFGGLFALHLCHKGPPQRAAASRTTATARWDEVARTSQRRGFKPQRLRWVDAQGGHPDPHLMVRTARWSPPSLGVGGTE